MCVFHQIMAKLSLIVSLTMLITQLYEAQSTHHPLCRKHPLANLGILYSNACYYVYATPRNNSEAFAVCEGAHTNLVFFPKVVPQLQIMNTLKAENISKIWLGLKQSTPTKWAWKYKEDFYPLVGSRWAPGSPVDATLEGVATSVNATWTRAHVGDNYSFVCEDSTPLDLYSVGCEDDSSANLVLYHPTLMQCYYLYMTMFNYTRARDLCYLNRRHVLHLETNAEIETFVHEMSARSFGTTLWLGIEEDEYSPDQWYWIDKHLSEPVTMDEYPWLQYSSTVGPNAVFSPNGTFIRALPTSHHRLFCEIDAFEERLGPFLCKSFPGGPVPVYRPTTRRCYYPFEIVETFISARSRCQSSGTHLMHADTEMELHLLFDKLQVVSGGSSFWLGLKREGDGSWNWVSSGTPISAGSSPEVSDFCDITSCPEKDLAYALQNGAELVQTDSTHQSQALCEEELSEAYVQQSLCTRHQGISTAILDFDGRRCYYVLNDAKTLDSATTACEDGGTHLLHIENILEELWLRQQLQARSLSMEVWLGLKRTSATEWSWFSSSWNILAKTLSFSSYDSAGPGFATLGATNAAGWLQTDPSRVQPVACEQKLDIRRVTISSTVETFESLHMPRASKIQHFSEVRSERSTPICESSPLSNSQLSDSGVGVLTVQTPTTTTDPPEGPNVYSDFKRYSGFEAFEWIQTQNVTSRLDCARKCNMLTSCVMFKLLSENNSMTCTMMALSTSGTVSDCSSPARCYKKHSSGLL